MTSSLFVQYLDLLLEQICDIVMKHTDASVLEACARLFRSLCSEQYTFYARSKTAIGSLLDSLADRLNPLLSTVLEVLYTHTCTHACSLSLCLYRSLSLTYTHTYKPFKMCW